MNDDDATPTFFSAQLPVGIDLGTTYSVIAYLDPTGRPTTVPSGSGDLITPSAVLLDEHDVVVGREALKASVVEPDKFADSFKRDMGASFFHRKIRGLEVPPEVLGGFILQQLKLDAERRLGPVSQAVITVPAFFDESRRKATQDAGRLAGLDVLDIINEPTAAAVAIGFQQGFLHPEQPEFASLRQRMFIYDLGGGTFDVTILEVEGGEFRAIATDGDVRLGGRDFDEQLVDYIADQFHKTHGIDPRSDPQDAAQLWLDAQEAKHTLSQRTKTSIACVYAGIRMRIEITREQFEDLTKELLFRTEATSSQVIREAGLEWSDIDRVLLVGGSTRMPMVPAMLQRLTSRQPDQSASPDEAVAHGAALYAGMLMKPAGTEGPACRLINVNSHSLGVVGIDVATRTKVNYIVIPRNTALPAQVTKNFITDRANQRNVKVRIVEGESRRPDECIALGECVVRDLPEGLPKGTQIQVDFSYAGNGRISVAARVPTARQSARVDIDRRHSRDLETLEVWSSRLRGLAATGYLGESGESGEGEVNLEDRTSILRRLDTLYALIGRTAAGMALPQSLSRSQLAAQQAQAAVEQAKNRLQAAEDGKRKAAGGSESVRAGADLAKAKSEHEQLRTQCDFAFLVLGRECVQHRMVPQTVQQFLAEIQDLQRRLATAPHAH